MKNKLLPYVNVRSVKEYFALPKSQREKWGIYLKPHALPWERFNKSEQGWDTFSKQIRKEYPIQGFIREWLFDMDNPVYAWFVIRKMRLNDIKYNIKNFFDPCCKRWRASYKRHQYKDVCDVILESNFALILDFWYDEAIQYYDAVKDNTDCDNERKEFYVWLKSAVEWIETGKQKMTDEINEAYKAIDYENYDVTSDACMKPTVLESKMYDVDKYHLGKMVEYRELFWS